MASLSVQTGPIQLGLIVSLKTPKHEFKFLQLPALKLISMIFGPVTKHEILIFLQVTVVLEHSYFMVRCIRRTPKKMHHF